MANPSFAEILEAEARRLTKEPRKDSLDPLSVIQCEISLTLHHIDRARELLAELTEQIVRDECEVGTKLLQAQERQKQESLYANVLDLQAERRRIEAVHEDKLQALHDRLLSLTQKFHQLRL